MLGYVTVNGEKLTKEESEEYRSYYCGLCRALKERYHQAGRMTLNYDMVFLYLLLTGLYEPAEDRCMTSCVSHPFRKHAETRNFYADYCADMNVMLAYYDLLDDWEDEHKISGKLAGSFLKKDLDALRDKYPRQICAMETYLEQLHICEQEDSEELDRAAGLSGTMLAQIMVPKEDIWTESLHKIGFYLGKFIYLCDAFEDLEADLKHGTYNPWKHCAPAADPKKTDGQEAFESYARSVLSSMMGECAAAFEQLPVLEHADLLRNILYSGVWSRFEIAVRRRMEKSGRAVRKEKT